MALTTEDLERCTSFLGCLSDRVWIRSGIRFTTVKDTDMALIDITKT